MLADQEGNQLEHLCCPTCRSAVAEGESTIQCTGCGQEFGYDNGIPDLRVGRFNYYFNPIPRDQMRSMSEDLSAENWSGSVRQFIRLSPTAAWVDNVAVHGRYAWKLLMELPPDARVLDIGCGLGALVSNIAPHVGRSYATDLTIERLIFANGRFRIFNGSDHVRTVASGDGTHLPFADGSFDAVFLSGVLEWVGEGDTSGFAQGAKWRRLAGMIRAHFGESNPRRIQARFLQEIRRILKPSGELYVGIENRLSYMYFGGRRDHHSGLWFGSLMPRFLATLYSIGWKKRPYRTYTYSLRGYRRLLAEAGFSSIDMFGFNEGYTNLKTITPACAAVQRWQPETPATWQQSIARHPTFVPAFGILAKPGQNRRPRLLDRLLADVEEQLNGQITFSSFDISHHDKAVLRGSVDGKPLIIKLPMSHASEGHERASAEALRAIRSAAPDLAGIAPEPLASGRHQHQPYFAEQLIPGTPRDADMASTDLQGTIQSVLQYLGVGLRKERLRAFDDTHFEHHVRPRLETLQAILENSGDRALVSEFFQRTLTGMQFTPGIMHGDLSLEHALVDDGRLSGLISWHAGGLHGIPAVDTISLATSVLQRENPGRSLPGILQQITDGEWRGSAAEPALVGLLANPGQNANHTLGIVYLYWLFHVSNQIPFRLQYEPERIGALVTPVLEVFRAHLRQAA